MTKRERDALSRRINRLAQKAAKKRDEVRALESDMSAIMDSIAESAAPKSRVGGGHVTMTDLFERSSRWLK